MRRLQERSWSAGGKGLSLARFVAGGALAAACLLLPASAVVAGTSWQWYTVDTHVHSVISGDAYPDLPIIARNAQAVGINAVMIGDHNLASSFPVSGVTANNVPMDDALSRWYPGTYGSLSSSTKALVTSPVHTGTYSLHLASTSSTAGESYERAKRGSNFRSGDDVITFSLYPTRLDPGSGLYISASVGGDQTIETPTGYTTTSGAVLPGKSNVFIYYFGAPPPSSFYGNARVVATPLSTSYCDKSFQLNSWITCTVRLDHTLPAIPTAEKPLDYDAFTELKMAAVANGGTADGYFDTYSARATAPIAAADEYTYRSTFVHNYDTSTFKIFPGVEMGVGKHTHRFNFDITSPSQFVSYQNGVDGIPTAQQTGFPTQVDHPALPGGISSSEAVSTNADGSDLMEVRLQAMIDTWDGILKKGVPLIGTWSSENHRGLFSGSSQETEVYAPALDFDSLMHSLFEGRAYMAPSSFGANHVIFNLDTGSTAPYPARYPIYLSSAQTSFHVHLAITGGISSGSSVVWITNGATSSSDSANGSYNATKSIAISGGSTYVRAELRSSGGLQTAMSEPIFFVPVAGLPSGMSYHVETVSSPTGPVYSKALTSGITASGWNSTSQQLSLTLTDTAGALAELRVATGSLAPTGVTVDGSTVAAAPDLGTFQAATGSSWFYDSAARLIYLKAKHTTTTASVVVRFGTSGGGNQAPTANPVSLNATSAVSTPWTPSVSDPNGNPLTCSIVSQPAHGAATVQTNCSSGTYTSNAGFTGADSFSYKANDGSLDSAPATVSVNVTSGGGGGGSVAFVQQKTASAASTTLPVALPAASRAGDALVAAVALAAGSSASVSSVTDSASGTWTKGPVGYLTGTNSRVEIWYRLGAPSLTSVTVTLSAAKSAAASVSEWSGVATASAVDASASGSGASSTTVATPSLATTNATDLIVGAVNYPATAASTLTSASFTSLTNFDSSTSVHGRAAYARTSSAGTYKATWTLSAVSGGNGEAILALKAA